MRDIRKRRSAKGKTFGNSGRGPNSRLQLRSRDRRFNLRKVVILIRVHPRGRTNRRQRAAHWNYQPKTEQQNRRQIFVLQPDKYIQGAQSHRVHAPDNRAGVHGKRLYIVLRATLRQRDNPLAVDYIWAHDDKLYVKRLYFEREQQTDDQMARRAEIHIFIRGVYNPVNRAVLRVQHACNRDNIGNFIGNRRRIWSERDSGGNI